MSSSVVNTIEHPYDASSILNWMLSIWDENPAMPVVVIINAGDGDKMNQLLRTHLSQARAALKRRNIPLRTQFGFTTKLISWNVTPTAAYEALCIVRTVQTRHRIAEMMSELRLK